MWVRSRAAHKLKNESSEKPVTLLPAAAEILRDWLRHRNDAPPGVTRPVTPYLFPNLRAATPWTQGSPGTKPIDRLKAIGKRLGIDPISFQILRRSVAVNMEASGAAQPKFSASFGIQMSPSPRTSTWVRTGKTCPRQCRISVTTDGQAQGSMDRATWGDGLARPPCRGQDPSLTRARSPRAWPPPRIKTAPARPPRADNLAKLSIPVRVEALKRRRSPREQAALERNQRNRLRRQNRRAAAAPPEIPAEERWRYQDGPSPFDPPTAPAPAAAELADQVVAETPPPARSWEGPANVTGGTPKLTEAQALEVCAKRVAGWSVYELADAYEVTRNTIYRVLRSTPLPCPDAGCPENGQNPRENGGS